MKEILCPGFRFAVGSPGLWATWSPRFEVSGAICSVGSQPPGCVSVGQKLLIMKTRSSLIVDPSMKGERSAPSIMGKFLPSEAGNRKKKHHFGYMRRDEPPVWALRFRRKIRLHLSWQRRLDWSQGSRWALPKPLLEKTHAFLGKTGSRVSRGKLELVSCASLQRASTEAWCSCIALWFTKYFHIWTCFSLIILIIFNN